MKRALVVVTRRIFLWNFWLWLSWLLPLLLLVARRTTTSSSSLAVAAFTIRGTSQSTQRNRHSHHHRATPPSWISSRWIRNDKKNFGRSYCWHQRHSCCRHCGRWNSLLSVSSTASFGSSNTEDNYHDEQQSTDAATTTTTTTSVATMTTTSETTMTTTTTTTATATATTTTTTTIPTWCPEQQIYLGGILPDLAEIDQLLQDNNGTLCLFGYGSLCWNPGTPGESALADPTVTSKRATAQGYRRCWAQKSNDHRGTPAFPGIVCTLLQDQEVYELRQRTAVAAAAAAAAAASVTATPTATTTTTSSLTTTTMPTPATTPATTTTTTTTEGVLFFVPPALVQTCLEELDFREKCGYARDVIQVVEDDTGITHSALLYRGTPDNPAIWPRALNDLSYAAAVLASAIGPSGPNSVYLNQLDDFLSHASSTCVAAQNDDTSILASMVRAIQDKTTRRANQLYFLTGCGSNQHNQLLLRQRRRQRPITTAITQAENVDSPEMGHGEEEEEEDADSHEMTELVVCGNVLAKDGDGDNNNNNNPYSNDLPQQLFAGGGHSGLLTRSGRLLLWGWNDDGQLGRGATTSTCVLSKEDSFPLPIIHPLPDILVETAAFGFSHTLVVERGTGRLYGFGSNDRGQVDGATTTAASLSSSSASASASLARPKVVTTPTIVTPAAFVQEDEAIKAVAAGVFHSACITQATDELLTFGCGRYGQCLNDGTRWKPADGSAVIQVACGRRHTVAVDDKGRIWTFGENKHGQLGRDIPNQQHDDDDDNDNGGDNDTAPLQKKRTTTLVDATPRQVGIPDHDMTKPCRISVHCGWSHTIITIHYKNVDAGNDDEEVVVYGWGRNDKGQLGLGSPTSMTGTNLTVVVVPRPQLLFQDKKIVSVDCGSESTYVLDQSGVIWGCGWNEHGNVGIGQRKDGGVADENVAELTRTVGARAVAPPPHLSVISSPVDNATTTEGSGSSGSLLFAAGGAHFLALRSSL